MKVKPRQITAAGWAYCFSYQSTTVQQNQAVHSKMAKPCSFLLACMHANIHSDKSSTCSHKTCRHAHAHPPYVCVCVCVHVCLSVCLSVSLPLCSLHPLLLPRPPCWPSGKASASRAEDPGFESRLRQDLFGVESYHWLKNWHSSDNPARRLAF